MLKGTNGTLSRADARMPRVKMMLRLRHQVELCLMELGEDFLLKRTRRHVRRSSKVTILAREDDRSG